jgi:hypothetical protein
MQTECDCGDDICCCLYPNTEDDEPCPTCGDYDCIRGLACVTGDGE